MIDVGWSELIFISIIALLLLGPKELPTVLRWLGRLMRKLRTFSWRVQDFLDRYD